MRPRQRHTGSGDGHVGRLEQQVYVVLGFVQNPNGVLTFAAIMRSRKRYAGSGDGHVGRLTRHVYIVLAMCACTFRTF